MATGTSHSLTANAIFADDGVFNQMNECWINGYRIRGCWLNEDGHIKRILLHGYTDNGLWITVDTDDQLFDVTH